MNTYVNYLLHLREGGSLLFDLFVLWCIAVVLVAIFSVVRRFVSEVTAKNISTFGSMYVLGFFLSLGIDNLTYQGCAIGGLVVAVGGFVGDIKTWSIETVRRLTKRPQSVA